MTVRSFLQVTVQKKKKVCATYWYLVTAVSYINRTLRSMIRQVKAILLLLVIRNKPCIWGFLSLTSIIWCEGVLAMTNDRFYSFFAHLNYHFAAPVQLTELVGNGSKICIVPGDLVLRFKVVERSVDPADLAVRPALHPVAPTQPLQRCHRDVHSLSSRSR